MPQTKKESPHHHPHATEANTDPQLPNRSSFRIPTQSRTEAGQSVKSKTKWMMNCLSLAIFADRRKSTERTDSSVGCSSSPACLNFSCFSKPPHHRRPMVLPTFVDLVQTRLPKRWHAECFHGICVLKRRQRWHPCHCVLSATFGRKCFGLAFAKIHKFNWVSTQRQQRGQKIMKYLWPNYQAGQRMSSGCTKIILKKWQNELTQKTLKVEINMFRHWEKVEYYFNLLNWSSYSLVWKWTIINCESFHISISCICS